MNDREKLAAALDRKADLHGPSIDEKRIVYAAARKTLAQLPVDCGTCDGRGWGWVSPKDSDKEPCPSCSGKGVLYPPELVEQIARAAIGVSTHGDRYSARLAVAVLDALDQFPAPEEVGNG